MKLKKYLEKFGEDSLDRVILPLLEIKTINSILKFIREIEKAIENNKPFEKIPEEQ